MCTSIAKIWEIMLLIMCAGCMSTGPNYMIDGYPDYNSALSCTIDQQLLTNIVKLKYRENPSFLEIISITDSHETGVTDGIKNAKIYEYQTKDDTNYITPQLLFSYSRAPTILYQPLRGQKFLQHLMTPLPFSAIFLMSQSGWGLEKIFNLCIEKINNTDNASAASGPTPTIKPKFENFYKMSALLQKLEHEHKLSLGLDAETRSALVLKFKNLPTKSDEMIELRQILNLDPGRDEFYFRDNFLSISRDGLSVRMRSLMGVLFYLSHAVEVPQEDIDNGFVTTTIDSDGNVFDWTKNAGGTILRVKCACSTEYPPNAFIKTRYRGKWFYVDDRDLDSKSIFMLVSYLFNLQSGKLPSPILTPWVSTSVW